MKTIQPLVLILIFQACCVAFSETQSPKMIGTWRVEITFPNGDNRSLRFEAQAAGKGSFLLLDPRSDFWESAKPSEASWTPGDGNSVTFSGAVEFPLGNVGRDAGRLVFKGKFENQSLIVGKVDFSPLVGDRPSKSGTFKAMPYAQ